MVTAARRDVGAIEGYVLMAMLALTGFSVVVVTLVAMLIRIEQAHGAADLSALAAASTGSCETGADAARRNGAVLVHCVVEESRTVVTVTAPSGLGRLLTRAGAPSEYVVSAQARI